jgi:hypothetical protein
MWSWRFTLSVTLGGLLVIGGFHALHWVLSRAFRPDNDARDAKFIMFQYYLRFAAIGVAIFLLMWLRLVNPLGLLLGLSVVVINLLALAASEFRGRTLFKEAG